MDMLEGGRSAHDGEVVGVACDSTNTLMISAGYHGDIKVCGMNGLIFVEVHPEII